MSKVGTDIHYAGLGMFIDYKRCRFAAEGHAERVIIDARFGAIFDELNHRGIRFVDCFMFVEDKGPENGYITNQGPFKKNRAIPGRPYDLFRDRNRFYRYLRDFCKLAKDSHIKPIFTLTLRPKYVRSLFNNNMQDVRRMKNPMYWQALANLKNMTSGIMRDIWPTYDQFWKIANELNHTNTSMGYGTFCENGHVIADMHSWIALETNITPGRTIIDVTASEFAKALFSYRSTCPYDGCGRVFDGADFPGRLKDGKVQAIIEYHGKSIVENLGEDYKKTLGLKLYPYIRFHEDGGGGKEAKGTQVGGFRTGDNLQTYEYGLEFFGLAKEAGKSVIQGFFPLTSLTKELDGEYRENYSVETADLERLDALIRAHAEIYGT